MLEKHEILPLFEQWEAKCSDYTKKQFHKELIRFERSFNTLHYAFSAILQPELPEDPQKRAVMLLVPKIIFLFKAIRDLTLKGHYFETSLLARSAIEGIGLCSLFSRDRNKASIWLKGKRIKIPKRQIAHEIAVFFKSASDKRVDLRRIYSSLSCSIHYDLKAVISFVPYKGRRKVAFQLLPVFEKEKAREYATEFSQFPLLLSTILWFVFEDELGEEMRKEMQDFFFEIAEEMRKEK